MRVRVYTTSYCGYCRTAKALLTARQIPFEEINVDDDDDKRDWLVKVTGRQTVPQIFIGDEPIGGYTELAKLDRSGELMRKISDSPD